MMIGCFTFIVFLLFCGGMFSVCLPRVQLVHLKSLIMAFLDLDHLLFIPVKGT